MLRGVGLCRAMGLGVRAEGMARPPLYTGGRG